mgnify:CR=1 FL=1
MQFEGSGSIYLQISEYVNSQVLAGIWPGGTRVPSVRELAVELEVNPKTIRDAPAGGHHAGGAGRSLQKQSFREEQRMKKRTNKILLGIYLGGMLAMLLSMVVLRLRLDTLV